MFGADLIYTALNVSAITDLLDSYIMDSITYKALFNDVIIPSYFTGKKSINYYLISPVIGAANIEEYEYSINCRAETFKESLTMAYTVHTALNRIHGVDSFKISTVLKTIPPIDETDVYNTPLTINLLKR